MLLANSETYLNLDENQKPRALDKTFANLDAKDTAEPVKTVAHSTITHIKELYSEIDPSILIGVFIGVMTALWLMIAAYRTCTQFDEEDFQRAEED